jgi:hypothetical protein
VTASQLKRFNEGEAGADIRFADFKELDNNSCQLDSTFIGDSEIRTVPETPLEDYSGPRSPTYQPATFPSGSDCELDPQENASRNRKPPIRFPESNFGKSPTRESRSLPHSQIGRMVYDSAHRIAQGQREDMTPTAEELARSVKSKLVGLDVSISVTPTPGPRDSSLHDSSGETVVISSDSEDSEDETPGKSFTNRYLYGLEPVTQSPSIPGLGNMFEDKIMSFGKY